MVFNSQGKPGQQRSYQHRRQASTPSALEAAMVKHLPQRAIRHAHRRGQSLGQRAVHAQKPTAIQDELSATTNAVQLHEFQRIECDPHLVQEGNSSTSRSLNQRHLSQNSQSLGQSGLQASTADRRVQGNLNLTYISHNAVLVGIDESKAPIRDQTSCDTFDKLQQRHASQSKSTCSDVIDHQLLDGDPRDIDQQNNFAKFQHQCGMPRRLSTQSDSSTQLQLQYTPLHQRNTDYNLITPMATPFHKSGDVTCENEKVALTENGNRSAPKDADESVRQDGLLLDTVRITSPCAKRELSSPPDTPFVSFDFDASDMFDYKQEQSFGNPGRRVLQHHYTPSESSSFYSAPELADIPPPDDNCSRPPKVPIVPTTPSRRGPLKGLTNSPAIHRTGKAKISPRPASIDNLNLDSRVHASINETGVTTDEIASYIFGPDPEDGKWVCLHPECGRRFGRKENIKSHVQTHLGDRQYKCEHCGKCFVRGHDLKRHAKIHTGDKPYECLCGNIFARHDALTRHRQRGMCIGGYQGVVRKVVKRGRPRKHRPEMDDRQTKSARTRQRVIGKSTSELNKVFSDDIHCNSPSSEIFKTSIHAHELKFAFDPSYSLSQEAFTFTPPASPGYDNAAFKQSPTQTYRSITPSTEDEMPPMSPYRFHQTFDEQEISFSSENICQYPDIATFSSSGPITLQHPHILRPFKESTSEPELDIFIDQSATVSFDPDMASFPDYTNPLDGGMDLFQDKSLPVQSILNDEIRYSNDELPLEIMSKDFLMD